MDIRKVKKLIELLESSIPVAEPVAGACELLGLDPLYVANEGRRIGQGREVDGSKGAPDDNHDGLDVLLDRTG